ncbi:MAG: DnaJ domain-containing protein [Devosia sp.]|nr:DnaJ domain-containing protein [Devosia sp.]
MENFDPYLLLGLPRAATPGAIKAAYRQRVQTAHPDRGGNPREFIAIVKAFGLLSDPDARRLYDEAGIVDDDGVRSYRRDVTIILADMFDAAVETAVATGLRLERVNFVAQMRVAVEAGLADAKSGLARSDRDIEALKALRRRIRRDDGAENLFVTRLDAQIGVKTEQHSQIRRRVMLLETAIVELGNYRSELELISALEVASN